MNKLLTEMKRTNVGEPKQDSNTNATSIQILDSLPTLPDGFNHSLHSGVFNGSDIKIDLQVNFASEENASMVYTALSVDKELQPDKVKRDMVLSGSQLLVHFSAVEARFLRASFSAFMDILVLATRTIEQFGSS